MPCALCGGPTSRNRGKCCKACYLDHIKTHGFQNRYSGPWRFYCSSCNTPVGPAASLCAECVKAQRSGPGNGRWDNVTSTTTLQARRRARRRKPLALCEECSIAPALDVHHRDGDPFNNTPDNLMGLCRRCHMTIDGRMERRTPDGSFAAS